MEEKQTVNLEFGVSRGTDSAELVTVIKTIALRGSGKPNDGYRQVTQYWDINGDFLAENDPCVQEEFNPYTQGYKV